MSIRFRLLTCGMKRVAESVATCLTCRRGVRMVEPPILSCALAVGCSTAIRIARVPPVWNTGGNGWQTGLDGLSQSYARIDGAWMSSSAMFWMNIREYW